MRLTLSPRALSDAPSDAEATPLPSEDTTPPVTNTYLVIGKNNQQHQPTEKGKCRLGGNGKNQRAALTSSGATKSPVLLSQALRS
jgi:hypothetical protein